MHGCIVATVQLYHPDGREAMRPSTSTKGVIGINGAPKGLAPGTKRAPLGDELDPFQGIFLAALLCSALPFPPFHSTPFHSFVYSLLYCTYEYILRQANLYLSRSEARFCFQEI